MGKWHTIFNLFSNDSGKKNIYIWKETGEEVRENMVKQGVNCIINNW